jgi:hypothetical protein
MMRNGLYFVKFRLFRETEKVRNIVFLSFRGTVEQAKVRVVSFRETEIIEILFLTVLRNRKQH